MPASTQIAVQKKTGLKKLPRLMNLTALSLEGQQQMQHQAVILYIRRPTTQIKKAMKYGLKQGYSVQCRVGDDHVGTRTLDT